eukprot:CAMPEP_0184733292 /NCGR_PEP_ID=MMETSP0314-20130426/56920_1 /TAXON_ID=38298 /ORGANISM="Rhodella maculata, Strain CCMP 736" /LENGTH=60 /DNA_ID=CAMNT_0027200077 /DNA_START=6 /DNA_END=188 /DNA_ORIENTATION=+
MAPVSRKQVNDGVSKVLKAAKWIFLYGYIPFIIILGVREMDLNAIMDAPPADPAAPPAAA